MHPGHNHRRDAEDDVDRQELLGLSPTAHARWSHRIGAKLLLDLQSRVLVGAHELAVASVRLAAGKAIGELWTTHASNAAGCTRLPVLNNADEPAAKSQAVIAGDWMPRRSKDSEDRVDRLHRSLTRKYDKAAPGLGKGFATACRDS